MRDGDLSLLRANREDPNIVRTSGTSISPVSPPSCRVLLVVWHKAWLGAWSYSVVVQEHSLMCGIE